MKTLSLLLSGLMGLAFVSTALALKPGDEVKADALGKLEVIQGDLVKGWEPDKVYILECWATWCGPCIKAIPHVNALHQKYKDKGLRVVGVNVWEEEKPAAVDFVKKQGEGMSYPVAHSVRGDDFDKEWLTAAGVRGIPNAFVVRDGKLLLMTHPMLLDETLIENLLAGGERAEKAVQGIGKKKENDQKLQQVLTAFVKAAEAGDQATMQAKVAEATEINPDHDMVAMMKIEMAVVSQKWDEVPALLDGLKQQQVPMALLSVASRFVQSPSPDHPEKVKRDVATRLKASLDDNNPMVLVMRLQLAHLQLQLGDKEEALATAKAAVEHSKELPKEPLQRFVKSIEDGKPAPIQEVIGWVREAMSK